MSDLEHRMNNEKRAAILEAQYNWLKNVLEQIYRSKNKPSPRTTAKYE